MDSGTCPLMQLPTELRLLIYSFALLDTPVVTIGTAELVGSHPDVVHRLYGNQRSPFAGLPPNHEPIIDPHYNASLLSITNPAVISLPPATSCPLEQSHNLHSAHLSLLLTNKQINEELTSHFSHPVNRRTSLFLAFPHGLHILRKLTPHLLRQTQSIHLAGIYTSRTFCAQRGTCLTPPSPPRHQFPPSLDIARYKAAYTPPDSATSLGNLISSLFGPNPTHHIRFLELRIYYPGSDSYSTVWGDDNSPTVVALRSVYTGEIGIEVWRGQKGTGVYLSVRPNAEGERKRVVSTVWRRLEEGRRNEPACGTWVVDPKWPEWEDGEKASEKVEGDTIVSIPIAQGGS